MDEERWPSASMGQVREAELMRCFEILGVTEHHWLDELDVDMDTGLSEAGYEKVRDIMADVQPDTVLTFGPDGMTGHVAHMSVSEWATRALAEAGEARREGALRDEHAGVGGRIRADLQPVRRVPSGNPPVTPRDELSIDFSLPPELLELKLRAIEEHESQVGGMVEAFGEDIFRRAMKAEWFRLGASEAVMAERPSPVTDLDWDPERVARVRGSRGRHVAGVPAASPGSAGVGSMDGQGDPRRGRARRAGRADVRRRALRVPARGDLRTVRAVGASAVHGVRLGRGDDPGDGCRSGGRGAQRERRWVAALTGRDRDRTASDAMVRERAVRAPGRLRRARPVGRRHGQLRRVEDGPRSSSGLERAARRSGGSCPADDVHVHGDARGELARRRHAGDRDRRRPDDPGRRRLPDAHRRAAMPRSPTIARSGSCRSRSWRPRGPSATGAIDPLPEIADICVEEGLWFHVDGAYGGPAVFADDLRPSFAGIERADSIAFDPHKWLYTPLAGGCVVVRRTGRPGGVVRRGRQLHRAGQGMTRNTGSTWAGTGRSSRGASGR